MTKIFALAILIVCGPNSPLRAQTTFGLEGSIAQWQKTNNEVVSPPLVRVLSTELRDNPGAIIRQNYRKRKPHI